ncbi:odorant receptor 49b-like [Leptopilina boulardi]|uniref:odorant receptor 49b-like n=1 Tax=Leptopilina boulardi TaxID=63433 RepID=UPI0021F63B74|nr:odorant receptor 49b-like [Leptopilina boulardi]
MKDIFDNRYFYINKFLMCCIGQWPFYSAIRNLFIQCFIFLNLIIFFIITIGGAIKEHDSTEKVMEGLPIIFTGFNSLVYFIVCSFKRNMLSRLFNDFKYNVEFWSSKEEQLIIFNHANNGRILTICLIGSLFVTGILFFGTSLTSQILDIILPLNESRPKKFPFQVYYYVDCPEDYFYFIVIHFSFLGLIVVFIVLSAETVFAVFTEHACSLFKIVSLQLKKINSVNSEIENMKALIFCIEHHNRAFEFCRSIESLYSPYFLFMLVAYSAFISVSLIEVVLNFNSFEIALRCGANLIVGLFFIFLKSFLVQRFMDYGTGLADTIYESDWYEMSVKMRKILLFIMIRSRTPCKVTAGKLKDLSLTNVCSLLQASFSSFTLLMSVAT